MGPPSGHAAQSGGAHVAVAGYARRRSAVRTRCGPTVICREIAFCEPSVGSPCDHLAELAHLTFRCTSLCRGRTTCWAPTTGRMITAGRDDVRRRGTNPGGPPMSAETKLELSNVNVRIKISALWTSMLFVFIYVDHYSLFRADIRADIEAGKMSGFTINQLFLLVVTAYVAIPALMVFLSLILRPRIQPDRQHRPGRHLRPHHHRRRCRRVELLQSSAARSRSCRSRRSSTAPGPGRRKPDRPR